MKRYLILLILFSVQVFSQSEVQNVQSTLMNYINGSSFTKSDLIEKAFYKDAPLFLSKVDQPIWEISAQEYASWYKKGRYGKFNGRIGNVLTIDIELDIATAKVEIIFTKTKKSYIDLFLLKKVGDEWKIISKAASAGKEKIGKRILFIVSNAAFHGDTKLRAGASFSELVKAYDTFIKAGYSVDFVSPKGGSIPLVYIDTSDEFIKSYLYDENFMSGLKYTKTPAQIDSKNFVAVHYIGGSNAMYGISENTEIQKIAMSVYEDHGGIISSVCHGSIGIVNLKTRDGNYLISGKRVSGYPDIYENPNKEYFKQFPLLITKTIEKNGGIFKYSPRNTAHVEIDGRLVTGQNHLSSKLVAEKMIELLEK